MRSAIVSIETLRAHSVTVGEIADRLDITRHVLGHYQRGVPCPDDIRRKLDQMATEEAGPLALPRRHAENVTRRAAR